jgi:peptidoglycan/LPS O-acetylase OafA/YrhL
VSHRLPSLDGLRAISIALVILAHAVKTAGFPHSFLVDQAARQGGIGVIIFFCISGFLITWLLLNEEGETGVISLRGFYQRRAVRILPAALTFLAVVAVANQLAGHALPSKEILASLLFVRNLVPGSELTNHFWSLSIEEQFYLFWPLTLVLLPARCRLPATATLCVFAPLWRQLNREWFLPSSLNPWRTDLCYDYIMMGALIAQLKFDPGTIGIRRWLADRGNYLLPASVLLLALTLFPRASGFAVLPIVICISLQTAAISLAIWILVEGGCPLAQKLLRLGPVVWLGRVSYSLYLWQQLFCVSGSSAWHQSFPANVAVSLAAASLSHYLIERPCLRWRDKRRIRVASISGTVQMAT